jgi:hypothetical protein
MSDNRQAGGHKANLNNPNTSQESKEHSRDVIDGQQQHSAQRSGQGNQGNQGNQDNKNPGNGAPNSGPLLTEVAGGYKSTLKNPNASDDAKKHAKQQLDNL